MVRGQGDLLRLTPPRREDRRDSDRRGKSNNDVADVGVWIACVKKDHDVVVA